MRLLRAKIENYRSIVDTGWFDIDPAKTVLVGPNEAGKTAILKALQSLKPPAGVPPFTLLRDFPRSRYSQIQRGVLDPKTQLIVSAEFEPDASVRSQLAAIHEELGEIERVIARRYLDNRLVIGWHPSKLPNVVWREIQVPINRLKMAITKNGATEEAAGQLQTIAATLLPASPIQGKLASQLFQWLEGVAGFIDDENLALYHQLQDSVLRHDLRSKAVELLAAAIPSFVYYSNYYRVRPRIHLRQLAERIRSGDIDEELDFGSIQLLRFLGLAADDLAQQGDVAKPDAKNFEEQRTIQDKLDERMYRLNAAAVDLTDTVRAVWGDEDAELDIRVDGDYLKVVARDDLGAEVELDQRSEGFQWLVSFYIVFKAQAANELRNSILLLDEPGVSLHALKQQEFRKTVSTLAEENQTIYTTHSPFMVGPDELALVRVVEMKERRAGTVVHSQYTAEDPAALFPLQAALGYSLAQSLFAQQRNLVLEGMTDYWIIQSISDAMRDEGLQSLEKTIALVPAGAASRVVYFAVLLRSQQLKVAAVLDSDSAGQNAAEQDNLIALLTNKCIHRTKDFYSGAVKEPEIEDLLRTTLLRVAKEDLGWDAVSKAEAQPSRPVVQALKATAGASFSKDKLAKALMRRIAVEGAGGFDGRRAGCFRPVVLKGQRFLEVIPVGRDTLSVAGSGWSSFIYAVGLNL